MKEKLHGWNKLELGLQHACQWLVCCKCAVVIWVQGLCYYRQMWSGGLPCNIVPAVDRISCPHFSLCLSMSLCLLPFLLPLLFPPSSFPYLLLLVSLSLYLSLHLSSCLCVCVCACVWVCVWVCVCVCTPEVNLRWHLTVTAHLIFELRYLLDLELDNWANVADHQACRALQSQPQCTGSIHLSRHSQLFCMGTKDLAEVSMFAWQAFYQLEYLPSPCQLSLNQAAKNV